MKKFPFAFLLLLTPGTFASNGDYIRFLSVDGDPLIAGKSQNLSFCFAHCGAQYSNFEFVFEMKKGQEVLFQKKTTFFKAEDGQENVSFSLPGSLLQKGELLSFEVRLEHTSPSLFGDNYVCYQKKAIKQTPRETGGLFIPEDEEPVYSFQSLYYPHFGAETGRYTWSGVQRDKENAGNRFGLSEIFLRANHVPEEAINLENAGELRIYTYPERWKIGTKKKKFVAVPLSLRKGNGLYYLTFSKGYFIDKSDGTMGNGPGEIRDLIYPFWSYGMSLHFAVCLNSFSKGGETFLFYRDVTPQEDASESSKSYRIHWEEL